MVKIIWNKELYKAHVRNKVNILTIYPNKQNNLTIRIKLCEEKLIKSLIFTLY